MDNTTAALLANGHCSFVLVVTCGEH